MIWYDDLIDGDVIPSTPEIPQPFHGMIFRGTIDDGVLADDPNASTPAVTSISKLECYFQAKAEGLWSGLQTALDNNAEFKTQWDLTTQLDIDRPEVQAVGAIMGKDADALQTFFNNAKGRTS